MPTTRRPFSNAIPYDYRRTRAISAFDIRHNFVASYRYELPLDRLLRASRATKGWFLTGVLRLSTGLPLLPHFPRRPPAPDHVLAQ